MRKESKREVPVILVCGGRDFADRKLLFSTLYDIVEEREWTTPKERRDKYNNWLPEVKIIHGNSRGADRMAEEWAVVNWCTFTAYSADWENLGFAAGPQRNKEMLDKEDPDLVVAFPGGRGTANMVAQAKARGYEVIEV